MILEELETAIELLDWIAELEVGCSSSMELEDSASAISFCSSAVPAIVLVESEHPVLKKTTSVNAKVKVVDKLSIFIFALLHVFGQGEELEVQAVDLIDVLVVCRDGDNLAAAFV